jgi:Fic family protein
MSVEWIWQQPKWPGFRWDLPALVPLLTECHAARGKLLGLAGAIGPTDIAAGELNTLLQNIVTSSKIEGETLNEDAVRSSLAKRLGMTGVPKVRASAESEGLAELMFDATKNYDAALDIERLKWWHALLFPEDPHRVLAHGIIVGDVRTGDEPMQVVSGPDNRRKVHYEAPPSSAVPAEMRAFLEWFQATRNNDAKLDPLLRAGIAHFWFVTIHPFEDGNGRITRAITDLALAQSEHQSIRLYTMSASILADKVGYYDVLEASQKSDLDITRWLLWFLTTLKASLGQAQTHIEAVLARTRFWNVHANTPLNTEQRTFLTRILRDLDAGGDLTFGAKNYRAITGATKPTASRQLADLKDKMCIESVDDKKGPGARYRLLLPT